VRVYLSACTIYRDAARYLAEWIEFHRLVGVERLFLYDNGSSDDHRAVLEPYVEEGSVVLHEWAMPFLGEGGRGFALMRAFDDCLRRHREDSRWIAFLDIDEFLFSPTGSPLPELLEPYEQYPGVCVSRAEYGPSGHRVTPDGLVIENYVRRRRVRPDGWAAVKSIVDPARAIRALSAHTFLYSEGRPVDEDRRPVDPLDRHGGKPVAWSRFRVNHYSTKSEEERERKAELWRDVGSLRAAPVAGPAKAGFRDDVLAAYGPAVREALGRRASEPDTRR
jgi:Glycosyltransferase family 92